MQSIEDVIRYTYILGHGGKVPFCYRARYRPYAETAPSERFAQVPATKQTYQHY